MWLIIGLIIGAAICLLVYLQINKKIDITWYEWLIGGVGVLLLLFTIQNFFASFSELEPQAAWMFLLATGVPSLILIVLAWQLAMARRRKNISE